MAEHQEAPVRRRREPGVACTLNALLTLDTRRISLHLLSDSPRTPADSPQFQSVAHGVQDGVRVEGSGPGGRPLSGCRAQGLVVTAVPQGSHHHQRPLARVQSSPPTPRGKLDLRLLSPPRRLGVGPEVLASPQILPWSLVHSPHPEAAAASH